MARIFVLLTLTVAVLAPHPASAQLRSSLVSRTYAGRVSYFDYGGDANGVDYSFRVSVQDPVIDNGSVVVKVIGSVTVPSVWGNIQKRDALPYMVDNFCTPLSGLNARFTLREHNSLTADSVAARVQWRLRNEDIRTFVELPEKVVASSVSTSLEGGELEFDPLIEFVDDNGASCGAKLLDDHSETSKFTVPIVADDPLDAGSGNDTRQTPTVTPFNTLYTGLVWTDADWFKVTVPSQYRELNVDLRFHDAAADLGVRLYDSGGSQIANSEQAGVDVETIRHTLAPGDYYVQVVAWGALSKAVYELGLTAGAASFRVTVVPTGLGEGRVTSDPPGINCPPACDRPFTDGAPVVLTAEKSTASNFGGWAGCSPPDATWTNTTCTLTVRADRVVKPRFDPIEPTVTTDPASGLSETTARLNGRVNPNGHGALAWFEWGTSATSLSERSNGWSLPGAFTATALNADLSGLTPGGTYYFRVVAMGLTGVRREGAVLSFRALRVPDTPSVTSISPRTDHLIVTWTTSGTALGYDLTRYSGTNTSPDAGWPKRVSQSASSPQRYLDYDIAGCGTYRYQVRAYNNDGPSTWSNERSGGRACDPRLTLQVTGLGNVSSNPAGIDCGDGGTQCSATFAAGTPVTLTPTEGTGAQFQGFSGGGCGGLGPCQVTVQQDATVQATFTGNLCTGATRAPTQSPTLSAAGTSYNEPTRYTVTVGGDCYWEPASTSPWIVFDTSSGNYGTTEVGFFVSGNPEPTTRTGTITAAGTTYTVTQAGGGYVFRDLASGIEWPLGLATDSNGRVLVADPGNPYGRILRVTPDGTVSVLAGGEWSQTHDGSVTPTTRTDWGDLIGAGFNGTQGVAADAQGAVFVADTFNNRIRRISTDGVVRTLAGSPSGASGSANGTGIAARFNGPTGVAVDPAGNVYVADERNHLIRKVTPEGVATTVAGGAGQAGYTDGAAALARFDKPHALVVDTEGALIVVEKASTRIRRISKDGQVSTVATTTEPGTDAAGVALVGSDVVWTVWNGVLRKAPSRAVEHLAGGPGVATDGIGMGASMDFVVGIASDGHDRVYVLSSGVLKVGNVAHAGDWVAPPVGLTTAPVSTSQIAVTWQEGAAGVSDYHLERSTDWTTGWTEVVQTSALRFDNTGLPATTRYFYRVRAHRHSDNRYSSYTGAVAGVTAGAWPPGGFGRAQPVTRVNLPSTTPTLDWGASEWATSYEYCVDTVNNDTCDTQWLSTGPLQQVGLSNLMPYATYYWQVRARNASGAVEASGGWWEFTTGDGPGPPITFFPTQPSSGATAVPLPVTLAWDTSYGATDYEYCIDTSNNNACNATWVKTDGALSVTLGGLAGSTTYYWLVRAINAVGTTPVWGGWQRFTTAAKVTPSFSDASLGARTTRVKAIHLGELRDRVAELRSRYSLAPFPWTDAVLTPGATVIKAAHLTELRTALNAVYTAAGRTPPVFTAPAVVARQTVIRAADIAELRTAVLAIW